MIQTSKINLIQVKDTSVRDRITSKIDVYTNPAITDEFIFDSSTITESEDEELEAFMIEVLGEETWEEVRGSMVLIHA